VPGPAPPGSAAAPSPDPLAGHSAAPGSGAPRSADCPHRCCCCCVAAAICCCSVWLADWSVCCCCCCAAAALTPYKRWQAASALQCCCIVSKQLLQCLCLGRICIQRLQVAEQAWNAPKQEALAVGVGCSGKSSPTCNRRTHTASAGSHTGPRFSDVYRTEGNPAIQNINEHSNTQSTYHGIR